jgi:hypothetical protein
MTSKSYVLEEPGKSEEKGHKSTLTAAEMKALLYMAYSTRGKTNWGINP